MAELEDDAEEYPTEAPIKHLFVGTCTCPHFKADHNWIGCDIPDCPCEAHWEEA